MMSFDEDLDLEDQDDSRPEQDFATSPQLHSHSMDGDRLAHALDQLALDDPEVREMVTIIQTIAQAFGDKDELLARYAQDLENGLYLLTLEMRTHPARWAARVIRQMDERDKKRCIHELGEVFMHLANEIA